MLLNVSKCSNTLNAETLGTPSGISPRMSSGGRAAEPEIQNMLSADD